MWIKTSSDLNDSTRYTNCGRSVIIIHIKLNNNIILYDEIVGERGWREARLYRHYVLIIIL